ncbi:MAG: HipA domain-containing protein [Propionibacteriaceae bacterium]|jgi:serine/threonine-protein kinase HipA|nr:HipA domain-containing protein [Propionibacteriaceae bacterium]
MSADRIALHVLIDSRHSAMLEGPIDKTRLLYDADPGPVPLSLSLPTERRRWRHDAVHPWIAALFPDNERTVARWRDQFGVVNHDHMALLPHVGEDLAGAAQFVSEDRLPAILNREGDVVPLEDRQVGLLLDAIALGAPTPDFTHGRFSLAGAQAKLALRRVGEGWALPWGAEPSTHILKLAVAGLDGQALAEVLTMKTAARLGLEVAETWLGDFAGRQVIVVERYDRRLVEGRWRRVHQEDLGQAAGIDPWRKYEDRGGLGAAACADLLRRHTGESDVERFVDALIFNHLVQGTDAHARNYSVLLEAGLRPRLAPLYDLNSGLPYGPGWAQHAAMRIGGESRFSRIGAGHWRVLAADCGLDKDQVVTRVATLAAQVPDALSDACREVAIPPDWVVWTTAFINAATDWCHSVAQALAAPSH